MIKEVATRGADFAIITNPAEPTKKVDLKEVAKLPDATTVNLSQYNVFAYKKILKGMNLYPKFEGVKPVGLSEITGDISRKISKDGKYIGITAGFQFEDKKTKLGLRVTF